MVLLVKLFLMLSMSCVRWGLYGFLVLDVFHTDIQLLVTKNIMQNPDASIDVYGSSVELNSVRYLHLVMIWHQFNITQRKIFRWNNNAWVTNIFNWLLTKCIDCLWVIVQSAEDFPFFHVILKNTKNQKLKDKTHMTNCIIRLPGFTWHIART